LKKNFYSFNSSVSAPTLPSPDYTVFKNGIQVLDTRSQLYDLKIKVCEKNLLKIWLTVLSIFCVVCCAPVIFRSVKSTQNSFLHDSVDTRLVQHFK